MPAYYWMNLSKQTSDWLKMAANSKLNFFSAMQTASKNLMDTLSDIYEKEWIGQDMLHVQVSIYLSSYLPTYQTIHLSIYVYIE